MPHFVLDCSESILKICSEEQIIHQMHSVANSTQLFNEKDINVRVNIYKQYSVGNTKEDFIRVFANIMEGRSVKQKADLSKKVVQRLASMFPNVSNIAMSIREFEEATYCNRNMI
jgi:5-carboxymethyl-2-hydroxymuconate isomerase